MPGERLYTQSSELTPTPPFDFARSSDALGDFRPMSGEQRVSAASIAKAVSVLGQTCVFRLSAGGTVEEPRLSSEIFSARPLTPEVAASVYRRITAFLSLADDLRPFYAIGQQDPLFAPIIQRLYGYHQVKFLTPCCGAWGGRSRCPLKKGGCWKRLPWCTPRDKESPRKSWSGWPGLTAPGKATGRTT